MAATLAPQRISVTFPDDVSAFLDRRAKRDNLSVPQTLVSMVASIMEDEEDAISDEEDMRLSVLVEEAERNTTKFHTLDEVMEMIQCRTP